MIKLKVHCYPQSHAIWVFKILNFMILIRWGLNKWLLGLKFDHSIMVFVCVDFNLDYCLFICILAARVSRMNVEIFYDKRGFEFTQKHRQQGSFHAKQCPLNMLGQPAKCTLGKMLLKKAVFKIVFDRRFENVFAVGPSVITNKRAIIVSTVKAQLWSPVQHALCSSYNELQFAFSVYHPLVNSPGKWDQNAHWNLISVAKLLVGWVIKCCTLF